MTLTTLQNDRAVEHIRIAYKLGAAYGRAYPPWRDETESLALWALVIAAIRYREDYPVPFSLYAWRAIRKTLYRARLRWRFPIPSDVSDAPARPETNTFADREFARACLDGLPDLYRPIAQLVFRDGVEIEDAGEIVGVSRSTAYHRITRAIRLLRRQTI